MTETQQRFLKDIANRLKGGRIEELRLYPTVRVGPIESGVAIVALDQPADVGSQVSDVGGDAAVAVPSHESRVTGHEVVPSHESQVTSHEVVPSHESQVTSHEVVPSHQSQVTSHEIVPSHESRVTGHEVVASHESPVTGHEVVPSHESPVTSHDSRLSIHTAHFRHTVKGPDRGKWEFFMVHDADAPIETVESVVRGVARRAGEDGEPELLSGDDFQRALVEPWWTATA